MQTKILYRIFSCHSFVVFMKLFFFLIDFQTSNAYCSETLGRGVMDNIFTIKARLL